MIDRLPTRLLVGCLALAPLLAGCAADAEQESAPEPEPAEIVFGPVDGLDLPRSDLERLSAGDEAPDFTALALGGEAVTLSDFRDSKNVVLVFYRGHW